MFAWDSHGKNTPSQIARSVHGMSPAEWRRAIVLREILGPPPAMRDPSELPGAAR